jgi:hypothetical protein
VLTAQEGSGRRRADGRDDGQGHPDDDPRSPAAAHASHVSHYEASPSGLCGPGKRRPDQRIKASAGTQGRDDARPPRRVLRVLSAGIQAPMTRAPFPNRDCDRYQPLAALNWSG